MKKFLRNLMLFNGALIILTGCSKLTGKKTSDRYDERTGIDFSNPDFGGLASLTDSEFQETPPGMVLIDGGRFTMGLVQENVLGDYNNKPRTLHVPSFYIDDTEVTNRAYLTYLDWLEKVFPPENPKYKHIYNSALPDETVWKSPLANTESLSKTYLKHRAYEEYPVVGVSWIQANDYCKWRTNRVVEKKLIDNGILKPHSGLDSIKIEGSNHFDAEVFEADPKLLFGGNLSIYTDYATVGDEEPAVSAEIEVDSLASKVSEKGVVKLKLNPQSPTPSFRLPSEAEWEFAARSDIENRFFNSIRGRKKYSWIGNSTRDEYSKYNTSNENFKQGKGDYNGIPDWGNDNGDITTKVRSFSPNAFGLYDMGGNVAEWVFDVYRPDINTEDSDFGYSRGNIYQKKKIDPDGKMIVATFKDMVYDTLPNGHIVPRNIPGQLLKVPLTKKDTYLKSNSLISGAANFKNDDPSSSREFNKENPDDIRRMYNSPIIPKPEIDEETGEMILKYDTKTRTSLITNYSRVYKGGSWADREFWLAPGQRRFLEEYMSANYIGFRCAVDKVGGEKKKGKRSPFSY